MSKEYNEAFSRLFKDKDYGKLVNSYYNYKITYVEYRAKKDELYTKHGLETKSPISSYMKIKSLNSLLSKERITLADYDKHLKRTLKDIEEESYYKAQQELIGKTT